MTAVSVALTALLGTGGLAGLGLLVKSLSKAERGSTIVATVERGALVLERLNDRLEGDLAAERTARVAAETERDQLRAQLATCRRTHSPREDTRP